MGWDDTPGAKNRTTNPYRTPPRPRVRTTALRRARPSTPSPGRPTTASTSRRTTGSRPARRPTRTIARTARPRT
ncbi:hypothetical protein E1264_21575, partial [Actinomadura sp. KC216]